jgi:hypothetical protein
MAKGQTQMGTGQVAPVARWHATLKASAKLVPLGRLGEMQKATESKNSAAAFSMPVNSSPASIR